MRDSERMTEKGNTIHVHILNVMQYSTVHIFMVANAKIDSAYIFCLYDLTYLFLVFITFSSPCSSSAIFHSGLHNSIKIPIKLMMSNSQVIRSMKVKTTKIKVQLYII